MNEFKELTRKQLDQKLAVLRQSSLREVPRGGWTKTIRTALGMNSEALGKRIGVTQSAVSQLEASEETESISLASLRKLAQGLECELVYALVPKASLDEIMREQAHRRAKSIVQSVSSSMELEDQVLPVQEQSRQIERLTESLLTKPSTGFWDEV
jgi:predicted DNA-binding mobile mystery protein A